MGLHNVSQATFNIIIIDIQIAEQIKLKLHFNKAT